jgi:hypothetical protein
VHTLTADKQKRVRIPDAKPGQVFAYEADQTGTIITLHAVKKVESHLEMLELEDLDCKTLAPKERGKVDEASIMRAVRADRDSR